MMRRCNYCHLSIQQLKSEDIVDQSLIDELRVDVTTLQNPSNLTIKLINKTGSSSVLGSVISSSDAHNLSFRLQENEYDAIGIVAENGIADGQECRIIVSGKAQVLLKDTVSSTRGHVVFSADTDGRAITAAIPTPPNADSHFKEIGHCIESKDAGTNVLAWCIIHFN